MADPTPAAAVRTARQAAVAVMPPAAADIPAAVAEAITKPRDLDEVKVSGGKACQTASPFFHGGDACVSIISELVPLCSLVTPQRILFSVCGQEAAEAASLLMPREARRSPKRE